MSLFRQNNLLDVSSTRDCQKTLELKTCSYIANNNVPIEGESIAVHNLFLSSYVRNQDVYVRCDNNNMLYINAYDSNIPTWLQSDLSNIKISLFHNDVNAVMMKELAQVVSRSDFWLLRDVPTLSDIIREEYGYIPICHTSNQMSDLHNAVRETWYLDLFLNEYSLCNYETVMHFKNVDIEEIYLERFRGAGGGFLVNGADLINVSNDATTGFATDTKLGLCLLNGNVPSSSHFYNTYKSVVQNIASKNSLYESNVDIINTFLTNNLNTFLLGSNNLSDADVNRVLDVLELTKLRDKLRIENDEVIVNDLNYRFVVGANNLIVDTLRPKVLHKYPYYANRPFSFVFMRLSQNGESIDVVDGADIAHADSSNYGQVKVLGNLLSPYRTNDASTSIRYEYVFNQNITEITRLRQSLHNLNLDNVLNIIYEESVLQNVQLMRFENNLVEMVNMDEDAKRESYANIGLSKFVYTLDYTDLDRFPVRLSCFENDASLIQNKHALLDVENVASVLDLFHVKSVGNLNNDNFDISGNQLNMDYLNVTSKLSLFDKRNGGFVMCEATDGNTGVHSLPEITLDDDTKKGVVRMHDTLEYDTHGTYSVELLNEIYNELHDYINGVRDTVENIKQLLN